MANASESTALSQREFDTWREEDSVWKGELRAFITTQTEMNLRTEHRLTTMETHRKKDDVRVGVLSTLVSSIVGAVAGALMGGFK